MTRWNWQWINDLVKATFSATAGKLKKYIAAIRPHVGGDLSETTFESLPTYLRNHCIIRNSKNLVQWDARTWTHGTGVESGWKTDNFGIYVSSMFGYVGHSDAFKT